jgi:hypothetical protein
MESQITNEEIPPFGRNDNHLKEMEEGLGK